MNTTMSRHWLCVPMIALLPICFPVRAAEAEPAANDDAQPVLKADSKVTRILESLGDNEFARLPPASIHGDFNDMAKSLGLDKNGPGRRDYCLKMPWAPDRKRALYCGANHGVPHKINDVWEYDLPSNTWVLLSNPDYNYRRGFKNEKPVFKDGVHTSKNGNLLIAGHSFSAYTYDAQAKLMFWFHKPGEAFGKDESQLYQGPGLWGFDPYRRKWQHFKTKKPWPGRYDPGSAFNYVAGLNKSIWSNNRRGPGLWMYHHPSRSWEALPVKAGSRDTFPTMSAQKVYDSQNDHLIAHGGSRRERHTSQYSFKSHTWTRTGAIDLDDPAAPKGADKLSTFVYDSNHGVCLLCDNLGGYVWVYDATVKKWKRLTPKNSQPDGRYKTGIRKGSKRTPMGFFSPQHNVLVLSDGKKEFWVYRYKKR